MIKLNKTPIIVKELNETKICEKYGGIINLNAEE